MKQHAQQPKPNAFQVQPLKHVCENLQQSSYLHTYGSNYLYVGVSTRAGAYDMQNTGKQAFSSRSCASNHRSSRREARMAAAWSAIHPLMAAFSTSRAATQSGGSFGSGHIRSRWCAPSGRMTAMSEFERLRVTPPHDHGSKSPCVKRRRKRT